MATDTKKTKIVFDRAAAKKKSLERIEDRRCRNMLQKAMRHCSMYRPTLIRHEDNQPPFFPVFPCPYPVGTVCIKQFDRRVIFSDRDDRVLERTFSTREQANKFMANIPSVVEYIWVLDNGFR